MEDIDMRRWALLAGDWLIEENGEEWALEIRTEVKEIIHSLCLAALTVLARQVSVASWTKELSYLMEVHREIKEVVSTLPPQLVQISPEDRTIIAGIQILLRIQDIPGVPRVEGPEGILSAGAPIDLRWHS